MAMPSCTYPGCSNSGIYTRADGHQSCYDHRSIPWPVEQPVFTEQERMLEERAARARIILGIDDVNQQYATEAKPPANRTETAPGAIGGLRAASRARTAQNATRARKLRASRERSKHRRKQRQQIEILQSQFESSQSLLYHITTDMQRDAMAAEAQREWRNALIIRGGGAVLIVAIFVLASWLWPV